ncbi:hypothetical protein C0Q70_09753 [Pomacea canaliculata]|uniref:Evolutionarily conserved signaling intermediate in Toll pathway, mitochondrial n=2 Tax=Pomacea canaliculata TaxID=400727 RepID=A0A2T7PAQ1_POMCA|nr:hypothetical protein C0Q70_09753 [Pomacea canaliculata]
MLGRDEKSIEVQKQLFIKSSSLFEELAQKREKDKLTFCSAVQLYITKELKYRRGHVEFIYSALENMERFGVHRDLSVYKELLEVFPKEKMIPRSTWQVEWQHFPKQQQCAIDLMDQMEDYGVIPDHNFGARLEKIFGTEAHAFRKYRRMMYWMPKFKHANPYPIPKELPVDALQLALLALKRMSVDRDSEITVWQGEGVDGENTKETFIASSQSHTQKSLIEKHNSDTPLFVEGGFTCWLRYASMTYFILRADPDKKMLKRYAEAEAAAASDDNLFNWNLFWEKEEAKSIVPQRSVHEQDDGTVLAMVITGNATKESLVSWVRCLQTTNPALEKIPVVFKLRTPGSEIQVIGNKDKDLQLAKNTE